MLKGLQGEIEEVLNGISLSVGVLKELFHAYDFCCANMKLFFKVPAAPQRVGATPDGWAAGGLAEATMAAPGRLLTVLPSPPF